MCFSGVCVLLYICAFFDLNLFVHLLIEMINFAGLLIKFPSFVLLLLICSPKMANHLHILLSWPIKVLGVKNKMCGVRQYAQRKSWRQAKDTGVH